MVQKDDLREKYDTNMIDYFTSKPKYEKMPKTV